MGDSVGILDSVLEASESHADLFTISRPILSSTFEPRTPHESSTRNIPTFILFDLPAFSPAYAYLLTFIYRYLPIDQHQSQSQCFSALLHFCTYTKTKPITDGGDGGVWI